MILHQANLIAQAIVANGLTTGNSVQNPDNLLNTTDSTALFAATSDVIIGAFPFNLPQGAVVVGISGIMKARIDNNSIPAGSLTPVLVDDSSGAKVFYPGPAIDGLSNVLQVYEFGGQYDVWGNTWTPTALNNLKLQLIGNSNLEVAWASMTVFYYIPQETPVPPPFTPPGCADCDSNIQGQPFRLAQPWKSGQRFLIAEAFNTPTGDHISLDMIGECGGSINCTIDPDLRKVDGGNFIENFNIDAAIAEIDFLPNGLVRIDLGDIQQRGLGFTTPYGHDPANISEHAVGAVFIITNNGPFNGKLLKRCHIGTLVAAPLTVRDENDVVGVSIDDLNFIGENVQAEADPMDPRKVDVTVISNPTNVKATQENTNTGTNDTTPSITLTVPLTITAANYLRVKVNTENEIITSVEYNGVSMNFIGEQPNGGVNLKVAMFDLINPPVGTHDVVVSMLSPRIITAIATGWKDVDVTNPVDGVSSGAIGTSDAPTDSVTTTSENTVMDDVVGTTNNPTNFSQTGLWSIDGAVNTGIRPAASSSRRVLSPQLVSDTYGLSLSTGWAMLMAGIRGIASAPSGGGVTLQNNGVPLGTFTTLNLKPGLTAADAGGSVADITASPSGGGVESVDSTDDFIDVDNTDPINPKLSLDVTALANDPTFLTELEQNLNVSGGGGSSFAAEQNIGGYSEDSSPADRFNPRGATTNQDGSVMYTAWSNSDGSSSGVGFTLTRYERDASTGIFKATHQSGYGALYPESSLVYDDSSDKLYLIGRTGASGQVRECARFDGADLTNQILMTFSGFPTASNVNNPKNGAFTDGTYFYFNISSSGAPVFNRATLSGTTFTYVDDTTGGLSDTINAIYDTARNLAYLLGADGTVQEATISGATITPTDSDTFVLPGLNGEGQDYNASMPLTIGFMGSATMYLGYMVTNDDTGSASTSDAQVLLLKAFTRPGSTPSPSSGGITFVGIAGENFIGPSTVFMGTDTITPSTIDTVADTDLNDFDNSYDTVGQRFPSSGGATYDQLNPAKKATSFVTPAYAVTVGKLLFGNVRVNSSGPSDTFPLVFEICEDNAGSPGAIVKTVSFLPFNLLDNQYGYQAVFDDNTILAPNTTYWITAEWQSPNDPGNFSNMYLNRADAGVGLVFNGTTWDPDEPFTFRLVFVPFAEKLYRSLYTTATPRQRDSFIGFTENDAVQNNAMTVSREGAITGFTSLTPSVDYFISDDVPGEIELDADTGGSKVAFAISNDEVVISRYTGIYQ